MKPLLGRLVAAVTVGAVVGVGATAPAVADGPALLAQDRCATSDPTPTSQLSNAWQLQRLDTEQLWKLSTGKGIRIAVIDTGVSTIGSLYFDDNRVTARDMIPEADNPGGDFLDCEHGTIVTSLIAAGRNADGESLNPATSFAGIAPDAEILAYRTLKASNADAGSQSEENLQYTIDAVREATREGVDIINLSQVTFRDPLLSSFRAAVADAIDAGIVVVAAAGNSSQGQGETPYPAAFPGVISVGISNRADAGDWATNPSHHITIGAPGKDLVALRPSRLTSQLTVENQAYVTDATGTSFAAPIVTGVVALLLDYELRTRGVDLTPAEVTQRLVATADRMSAPLPDPYVGNGIVNPMRALTDLTSGPASVPSAVQSVVPEMPTNEPRRIPAVSMVALGVGIGAVGAVILGLVAAIAIPASRRRPGRR